MDTRIRARNAFNAMKSIGIKEEVKVKPVFERQEAEMQIFVRNPQGNTTTTLNVEKNETICSVKRKLREKEGIASDLHLRLIYDRNLLEDGHTLAHYKIFKQSTLLLFLSPHTLVETWNVRVETRSGKSFTLEVKSVDTVDDVKAKIEEIEGVPSHKQFLFKFDKWLEDGSRTLADCGFLDWETIRLAQQGPQPNVTSEEDHLSTPTAPQVASRQSKRPRPAAQTTPTKVTAALCDLMPEIRARPTSAVLTELEDLKYEMASARRKEKELEATIFRLTEKNSTFSAQIAAVKAENKIIKYELMVARSKEKEQEVTISGLKHKNKAFLDQQESYENQIVALKAKNKKIEEELMVARQKEKELEATNSGLMHKIKVFSAQCAAYESRVFALEAEYTKTKEQLSNASEKFYSEGLKEGKTTKSVEFLHHLADASMQYFNYGFDSCRKQAEQQGFVGQLDKITALKDAPSSCLVLQ